MTRRKSVQQLVNPLRKLSFLSSSSSPSSSQLGGHFQPDLELVPEQRSTLTAEDCQLQPSLEEDILCLFPREVILKILSLLSFQDLCQVQLVKLLICCVVVITYTNTACITNVDLQKMVWINSRY